LAGRPQASTTVAKSSGSPPGWLSSRRTVRWASARRTMVVGDVQDETTSTVSGGDGGTAVEEHRPRHGVRDCDIRSSRLPAATATFGERLGHRRIQGRITADRTGHHPPDGTYFPQARAFTPGARCPAPTPVGVASLSGTDLLMISNGRRVADRGTHEDPPSIRRSPGAARIGRCTGGQETGETPGATVPTSHSAIPARSGSPIRFGMVPVSARSAMNGSCRAAHAARWQHSLAFPGALVTRTDHAAMWRPCRAVMRRVLSATGTARHSRAARLGMRTANTAECQGGCHQPASPTGSGREPSRTQAAARRAWWLLRCSP